MNSRLLVSPIVVSRASTGPRLLERAIPALARAGAALSRAMLGGRGIGFGCTVAAGMIGRSGRVSFKLAGGGSFGVGADDRYWLDYLLLDQSYETDLDHFVSRALTPKDSFLDCGANLGLWSIAAARVINKPKRVVAVEAGSRTFTQLKQNWQENQQSFTIVHRAVGTATGEQVSFFASVDDHASATLVKGLSPGDALQETVTTISLADLIENQSSRSDASDALIFTKLDIEGMERDVIATLDPEQYGQLLLLYEDHGSERDHVTGFVLDQGFKVAFLADNGSLEVIDKESLHRLDALKTDPARGYNLLAYSPSGPAAVRMAELFGLRAD